MIPSLLEIILLQEKFLAENRRGRINAGKRVMRPPDQRRATQKGHAIASSTKYLLLTSQPGLQKSC